MLGPMSFYTVITSIAALIAIGLAVYYGLKLRQLKTPLARLSQVSGEYSKGSYSMSMELDEGHELFPISQALNKIPTIYESLVVPLRSFLATVEEVNNGDFNRRVEITKTTKEIKTIADSYNLLLSIVRERNELKEERDRTQGSIMKLLDDISGVAEGDLRHHAEVTEDITGAIADSINYMINELRRIIGNVNDSAINMSGSSDEVQSTIDELSKGSEIQSGRIIDITSAIDEMTDSIREVSDNSEQSSEVAKDALTNAINGREAVRKTIIAMDNIRERVHDTAKTIKKLGESSQEIGEIAQLIGEITEKTSVLALNASIQASMAGEAGLGFRVVAEEVERLAETAAESTRRIDDLITAIQSGTNQAVSAMEDTTHSVVEGSGLANDAGKALEQIENVSTQLADLIHSISVESLQLSRGSGAVSQTMVEIYQISQAGMNSTMTIVSLVQNLNELAKMLKSSVSAFKLPPKPGPLEVIEVDQPGLDDDIEFMQPGPEPTPTELISP